MQNPDANVDLDAFEQQLRPLDWNFAEARLDELKATLKEKDLKASRFGA